MLSDYFRLNAFTNLFFKFSTISIIVSFLNIANSFVLAAVSETSYFNEYIYLQSVYLILINLLPIGINGALIAFYKEDMIDITLAVKKAMQFIIPIITFLLLCLFILINYFFNVFDNIINIILITVIAYLFSNILLLVSYFQVSNNFYKAGVFLVLASISYFFFMGFFGFKNLEISFALISSMPILCILILIGYQNIKIKPIRVDAKTSKRTLVSILKFSIPNALHASITSFLITGDRIFLINLLSAEDFKLYSIALLTCSILLFLVNNFAGAWGLYLIRLLRSDTSLNSLELLKRNQLRALLIFISPILFLPIIMISIFYFDIKNDNFFMICVITSFNYSIWAYNKIYLGYLNYYKDSIYILKISILGLLIFMLFPTILDNFLKIYIVYPVTLMIVSIVMLLFLRKKVYKYLYESPN